MQKFKILFFFIILIMIPSYFIFKEKDLSLASIKLPSLIKKDTENHNKAVNGEVTITEKDLSDIISKNNKLLENTTAIIGTDDISIRGELKAPKQVFESRLVPKVIDGKFALEIIKLKVGFVEAPEILTNKIETVLNKSLDRNINNHYKIKSVIIKEKEIVLIIK